jgi:hypothetical protein
MLTKFVDGVKRSFETLNILIVSAVINFINGHLIGEDSFYAFNELLTRFLGKINSDSKAIDGTYFILSCRYNFSNEYTCNLSKSC